MEEKYLEIKNFVESVYKSDENRMKFIARIALTYGLKLMTLETIFGTKNDDMQHNLLKYNNQQMNSHLLDLFSYGIRSQETAVLEAYDFIMELKNLLIAKGKAKAEPAKLTEIDAQISQTMAKLADVDIKKFKDNHQTGAPLTDAELVSIVKFQIKYLLTDVKLCALLKITNEEYKEALMRLENINPALNSEYQDLSKLHNDLHDYATAGLKK